MNAPVRHEKFVVPERLRNRDAQWHMEQHLQVIKNLAFAIVMMSPDFFTDSDCHAVAITIGTEIKERAEVAENAYYALMEQAKSREAAS
jgi:hypothetical protein